MSSDSGRSRSARSAVIVEIGSDWIKMAATDASRAGVAVSRLHLESFETFGPAVADSIAMALGEAKFPNVPAIGSLPRQMVNVRILELPSTDPEEIADMVDLQVGKQTPYTKDEIVSDYRILGGAREGYTRVMLAIVQRNVLRERFYLLEEAGLDVEGMSISTEGVLNWYNAASARLGLSGTVVVMDVDSFYTDFIVVSNESLCFTRSILVGANQLLEDYERSRDKLLQEAKGSLEVFAGEVPDLRPDRVVITGAGARIPALADDLGTALGMEAIPADCLEEATKLPASPDPADPAFAAVSLTPLIGMGLDPGKLEFSLIPDSVRMKKALVRKARALTVLAMLLMAVLVSLSSVASLKLFLRREHLSVLREERMRTDGVVQEVMSLRELNAAIRKRQNVSFSAVALLSEIHQHVPAGAFLDSLEIDISSPDVSQHKITLRGLADDRKIVRTLVDGLAQSDIFANVENTGSKLDRSRKLRFEVVCLMQRET